MLDLLIRFLIGGSIVSIFAMLGDIFRPKSFAGLFGAAPSIAFATLSLAIHHDGRLYAAIEARSMIAGAIALFIYTATASWILMRFKPPALLLTVTLLPLWLGISFSIWHVCLR